MNLGLFTMMSQPIRLIWIDWLKVENYQASQSCIIDDGRWVGWGGPGHYVVTPTRVEADLGCDNKSKHSFKTFVQSLQGILLKT